MWASGLTDPYIVAGEVRARFVTQGWGTQTVPVLVKWVLFLKWLYITTMSFKQLCFEQAAQCVLWPTAGVWLQTASMRKIKFYQINQRMIIHFIKDFFALLVERVHGF